MPERIVSNVVLGWDTLHPNIHVQSSKLLPHGVDQAILVKLLRRTCKCLAQREANTSTQAYNSKDYTFASCRFGASVVRPNDQVSSCNLFCECRYAEGDAEDLQGSDLIVSSFHKGIEDHIWWLDVAICKTTVPEQT